MIARDAPGQATGFNVAAKGGHNDESHNHNDIGHFVLYLDGLPVVVDAGVETYTKMTFGPQRYDIWTMQSAWHNLPTIGGLRQLPGATYGARSVVHKSDEGSAELQLDTAAAYDDGVLTCWQRTIHLQRGRYLQVADEYELGPRAQGPLELSLITACDVVDAGQGQVQLSARALARTDSGRARLAWNIPGAALTVECLELTDARMRSLWGDNLHRLRFTIDTPPRTGSWQLRFERDDT